LTESFIIYEGGAIIVTLTGSINLKITGKWEEFEQNMVLENKKSMLRNDIEQRMSFLREFKPPTLYFEDGRFEQLAPVETFLPMLEEVQQDIEKLVAHLEALTQSEQTNNGQKE
jgi:hypothetical protein